MFFLVGKNAMLTAHHSPDKPSSQDGSKRVQVMALGAARADRFASDCIAATGRGPHGLEHNGA